MQRSHNTTDIVVLLYCIVLFVQKLVNYREGDELIEQWVVSPAPGTVIYVLRTWSVHSWEALGPCLGSPGSSIISRNTANFPLRHKTKVVSLLFFYLWFWRLLIWPCAIQLAICVSIPTHFREMKVVYLLLITFAIVSSKRGKDRQRRRGPRECGPGEVQKEKVP